MTNFNKVGFGVIFFCAAALALAAYFEDQKRGAAVAPPLNIFDVRTENELQYIVDKRTGLCFVYPNRNNVLEKSLCLTLVPCSGSERPASTSQTP